MHALAPYSIRVYDKSLAGEFKDRYHSLDNIRGNNLLIMFNDFAESNKDEYLTFEKDNVKKTIRFSDVVVENDFISGFIEHGEYGIKGKIVDIVSGEEKYLKTTKDSDIYQLYFCVSIPDGGSTGICLFHSVGTRGVKTIIDSLFNNYFSHVTEGLKAQINPLSSEKAINEWMENADIKEISLLQYTPKTEVSDIVDGLADNVVEVSYKPKRGRSFGNLLNFKEKLTENDHKVVSVLGEVCTTVKATAQLGERMRVFRLNSKITPHSSIEFDEDDVEMDEGMPDLESLNIFAKELIEDFQKEM